MVFENNAGGGSGIEVLLLVYIILGIFLTQDVPVLPPMPGTEDGLPEDVGYEDDDDDPYKMPKKSKTKPSGPKVRKHCLLCFWTLFLYIHVHVTRMGNEGLFYPIRQF